MFCIRRIHVNKNEDNSQYFLNVNPGDTIIESTYIDGNIRCVLRGLNLTATLTNGQITYYSEQEIADYHKRILKEALAVSKYLFEKGNKTKGYSNFVFLFGKVVWQF